MAILIVDHQGQKRGAVLRDRVLIGRRSMNHLVIEHNAVSRMHAWIDRGVDGYVLTDMRSRSGTRVNQQPVAEPLILADGDVIEIGPARLTFHTTDRVPLDVESFELPRHPVLAARDAGVRFDCPQCRAPFWAAPQFAGTEATCVYCGATITLPKASPPPPPPPPPPPMPRPNALPGPAQIAARDSRLETLQVKPESAPLEPPVEHLFTPLALGKPKGSQGVGVTTTVTEPSAAIAPTDAVTKAHAAPSPVAVTATKTEISAVAGASTAALVAVPAEAAPVAEPTVTEPTVAKTPSVNVAPVRPPAPAARQTPESPSVTPAPAKTSPPKPTTPAKPAARPATPPATTAKPPAKTPPKATPAAPASTPSPAVKCGVCHSPILPTEARTTCPNCKLVFHEECWQENYGCSAYGCTQVNVLKPTETETAEAPSAEAVIAADPDLAPPKTPWAYMLLGVSALGVVASAVSFGGASALMLLISLVYLLRTRNDPDRKTAPVVGAILLNIAGIAGGAVVSMILFRVMK
jgi:hypothetical protein